MAARSLTSSVAQIPVRRVVAAASLAAALAVATFAATENTAGAETSQQQAR